MKKFVFIMLMMTVFFACKKDKAVLPDTEVVLSDSFELQQEPGWQTEKFKFEYTIQFPDYYSGGYVQGFEGGWFDKQRNDPHAVMSYMFSNGLQTFDFGDTLSDENATSIEVADGGLLLFLNQRINFTHNGTITGILFHNDVQGIRRGELYWKDGGVYLDALIINYDTELQTEIISIVRTIQHQ